MNECWNWNMLRSEIVFIVLLAVVIVQPVVLAHNNPPYTTYSSFSDLMAGEDGPYPKLVRVSEPGTRESPNYTGFFFYQCQQFDPTDRYMLGMRVHCQNRDVRPTDRAEIGLIDLQDGYKWIRIGDTTAWNWQQGSRLQWRPGSNEVLWNDRSDDGRRYVCRAYDFKTGARRTLPRPVYIPSPDGDVALTHDFERMKHGGTPYVGIEDEYADQYAPKKTGIWRMDLNTGEAALIMSLDQMGGIAYPGGAPSSGCLYFFREGWNPSGSRFVAFVKDPDNKFDKAFSLTANGMDVRYLYDRPSHHEWRDDDSVLDGRGYYLYPDDGTGKAESRLFESPHNGHVSYISRPGGDWIISDTYAIEGHQYLFLYHIPTRQFVPRGTEHITLRDLVLECTRGSGVEIIGGRHNLVAGCTLRNIGTVGAAIGGVVEDIERRLYNDTMFTPNAGTDNGVVSCDIYNTGECGIILAGGDRRTLEPGRNYAVNNRIYNFGRWVRTYRPAVFLCGVGNRVAHNLMHDAPHTAVFFLGNDHILEFDEVYRVCAETGDAGAFYIGGDWSHRGSVVRYNYFHDLGASLEGAAASVVLWVFTSTTRRAG